MNKFRLYNNLNKLMFMIFKLEIFFVKLDYGMYGFPAVLPLNATYWKDTAWNLA